MDVLWVNVSGVLKTCVEDVFRTGMWAVGYKKYKIQFPQNLNVCNALETGHSREVITVNTTRFYMVEIGAKTVTMENPVLLKENFYKYLALIVASEHTHTHQQSFILKFG